MFDSGALNHIISLSLADDNVTDDAIAWVDVVARLRDVNILFLQPPCTEGAGEWVETTSIDWRNPSNEPLKITPCHLLHIKPSRSWSDVSSPVVSYGSPQLSFWLPQT